MTGLADTSLWIYAHRSRAGAALNFGPAVHAGQIATCEIVILELLRGARDAEDHERWESGLRWLPCVEIGAEAWRRAREVSALLVSVRAPGRRPPPTDLLIAAAAEIGGIVLLHRDRHYDAVAAVTGQPVRWVGPV